MDINILIVEDNEYKRNRVIELVKLRLPKIIIEERHSFTSAWQAITQKSFNLILLDMSLPTFDKTSENSGGVFRVFGGSELASKMKRRNFNSKFIFITQYTSFSDNVNSFSFEELKKDLTSRFENRCAGFILYSNNKSDWKEELINIISEVINENTNC